MVRIAVTVGAFGKRHTRESSWTSRRRGSMAFRAGYLRVEPGERKSRLAVIDFCGGFPVNEVVALHAICAELTLVGIFVASGAIRRQS